MKLSQLFSIRRLQRCRQLFRFPLSAHFMLARASRGPGELELKDGSKLHLHSVRSSRHLLDWSVDRCSDVKMQLFKPGVVELSSAEHRILLPAVSSVAFHEVFANDTYRLNAVDKPLGTVVDLGGNVGMFTVRVAPLADRVITVEAVSSNFKISEENVRRLPPNISQRVRLHHRAIGGESGRTVEILLNDENPGGHSVSTSHMAGFHVRGTEKVSTISLADLFEQEAIARCSLLKCDVEGAEFDVFEHAPESVLARIDRIAMEIHPSSSDRGTELVQKLVDKLSRVGFHVEHDQLHSRGGKIKRALMLYAENRSSPVVRPVAA